MLAVLLNILWVVLGGLVMALGHVGVALTQFGTIIGIPFGIQHLKLALIALAPVGQTIVDKDGRSLL